MQKFHFSPCCAKGANQFFEGKNATFFKPHQFPSVFWNKMVFHSLSSKNCDFFTDKLIQSKNAKCEKQHSCSAWNGRNLVFFLNARLNITTSLNSSSSSLCGQDFFEETRWSGNVATIEKSIFHGHFLDKKPSRSLVTPHVAISMQEDFFSVQFPEDQ